MRPRLRLPTRLAVTVLGAAACSSPEAPVDASADVARVDAPRDTGDDALRDALLGDVSDATDDVADASGPDVFDSGRTCTPDPLQPENPAFAVRCLPRRGETAACPAASVCVAADCPAHCEGCVSPLFCIPDPSVDAGVACAVGTVCTPEACNPGCRAVG